MEHHARQDCSHHRFFEWIRPANGSGTGKRRIPCSRLDARPRTPHEAGRSRRSGRRCANHPISVHILRMALRAKAKFAQKTHTAQQNLSIEAMGVMGCSGIEPQNHPSGPLQAEGCKRRTEFCCSSALNLQLLQLRDQSAGLTGQDRLRRLSRAFRPLLHLDQVGVTLQCSHRLAEIRPGR